MISFTGDNISVLVLNEGSSGEICVSVLDGVTEREVELIATTEEQSATGNGASTAQYKPSPIETMGPPLNPAIVTVFI